MMNYDTVNQCSVFVLSGVFLRCVVNRPVNIANILSFATVVNIKGFNDTIVRNYVSAAISIVISRMFKVNLYCAIFDVFSKLLFTDTRSEILRIDEKSRFVVMVDSFR